MKPKFLGLKLLLKYSKLSPGAVQRRLYVAKNPKKYGIINIGGHKMVGVKDFETKWKPNEDYFRL